MRDSKYFFGGFHIVKTRIPSWPLLYPSVLKVLRTLNVLLKVLSTRDCQKNTNKTNKTKQNNQQRQNNQIMMQATETQFHLKKDSVYYTWYKKMYNTSLNFSSQRRRQGRAEKLSGEYLCNYFFSDDYIDIYCWWPCVDL